ncbi:hypothetical protein NTH38_003204 [Vibrio cholerae]
MSKTLNYSLLLLRSSESIQRKIFRKLDTQSRKALEEKLSAVPKFELSKLRKLKAQILSTNLEKTKALECDDPTLVISCEATERAVNYIIASGVFNIESKESAAAYYQALPKRSQELIEHYLETREVADER